MERPISIRGLSRSLLVNAKKEAERQNKSLGEWVNDAIQEKLIRDFAPIDLTALVKETKIKEIWEVPSNTIKTGNDYSLNNYLINAAGRKNGKEAVTYRSPQLLHDNGYQIFWIR